MKLLHPATNGAFRVYARPRLPFVHACPVCGLLCVIHEHTHTSTHMDVFYVRLQRKAKRSCPKRVVCTLQFAAHRINYLHLCCVLQVVGYQIILPNAFNVIYLQQRCSLSGSRCVEWDFRDGWRCST